MLVLVILVLVLVLVLVMSVGGYATIVARAVADDAQLWRLEIIAFSLYLLWRKY